MALGDVVRWRRSQLGLTQEEVARRDPAGTFTQAEISQYEKHKVARPSRARLERLAGALGLPYDLLTAATYQPAQGDAEVAEFVRRWRAQREGTPADADAPPHDRVLADLAALAETRPDLLRAITRLREENAEETYRRALAIVWRHMVAGLETAADLLSDDAPAPGA